MTNTLTDLAALFNAKLFNLFNRDEFLAFQPSDFGSALKIESSEHETFFISAENKPRAHLARLSARIAEIESQYRGASRLQLMACEERLNRLTGSMAMIKIGGLSEPEQQEAKDKLVDGLNAVRNILDYGGLPGGGAALVHATRLLDIVPRQENQDVQNGLELMKEVFREPMKCIVDNSGRSGRFVVEELLQNYDDPWIGYDVNREQFGDMASLGVIDSLHNLKNALIDACSIGSMMLTTEVVVSRKTRYNRTHFLPSNATQVLPEAPTVRVITPCVPLGESVTLIYSHLYS